MSKRPIRLLTSSTRADRWRLEIIIVLLIAFEIVITFYQIYAGRGH